SCQTGVLIRINVQLARLEREHADGLTINHQGNFDESDWRFGNGSVLVLGRNPSIGGPGCAARDDFPFGMIGMLLTRYAGRSLRVLADKKQLVVLEQRQRDAFEWQKRAQV